MDQQERTARAKAIREQSQRYIDRLRELRRRQREATQQLLRALEDRKMQDVRKQLGLS